MLVSSKFSGFLQLSEYMPVDKFTIKLSQGMNECVDICVHDALQWTGIPFRVNYNHVPSVARIDSGSTMILTRIKWLLKVNE